jgi:hypothetical protein
MKSDCVYALSEQKCVWLLLIHIVKKIRAKIYYIYRIEMFVLLIFLVNV